MRFPALGIPKRWLLALWHTLVPRKSYAQFGEDTVLLRLLQEAGYTTGHYVDVGANHPTAISNTYLLYRHGYRGIAIEPNKKLCGLFARFRKGDTALAVGCADVNELRPFYVSKTPVISTFSKAHNLYADTHILKTDYVPILRLDDCLRAFNLPLIHVLSIDVEGLNREVLAGAPETLQKTHLLCIEYDSEADLTAYRPYLHSYREVHRRGCNVILENIKIMQTKLQVGL